MKRVLGSVVVVVLVGCGEKVQEMKNAANAVAAVAAAASNLDDIQKEAAQFDADRRSRGDTIAMGYADLQKHLPSPPDGYKADEGPSGSSQDLTGWSTSQAEQKFSGPDGPDGSPSRIIVSLVDFGGTQAASGMLMLPMMMNLSQEDAHQRMRTLKMDTRYTWGSEEYNKDNKNAKVTVTTRYRYTISVEAQNQTADESAMAKRLAESIAKTFAGK